MIAELKPIISSLPQSSGVYLMKDCNGQILYIGKAVNLRRRVQSYFRGKTGHVKTNLLVSHITAIDHILTHSEAEALILEAALVREHQPKYNIELKDSKTYPYIRITDEPFPQIAVIRVAPGMKSRVGQAGVAGAAGGVGPGTLFGPYTDATLVRAALDLIRKIFPFRTCEKLPNKACLYHDIGLCPAPCIGKVTPEDQRKTLRHITSILLGKKDELYRQLRADMEEQARAHRYEQAAVTRDQMRAIGALYSSSPDINYFKEAEQLERALSLPRRPERIECIDISTIMGEHSVGSLVVFLNGAPDKSSYRRFRIKMVRGMDDFQMVAEVVRRRYGRLQREGRSYPDLILIDGGKGQLAAAAAELEKLAIDIPLASLAKREEEIFLPGKRAPVVLSRESLALKLLQRLRDEAHRFAVAYHRLLRGKKLFES